MADQFLQTQKERLEKFKTDFDTAIKEIKFDESSPDYPNEETLNTLFKPHYDTFKQIKEDISKLEDADREKVSSKFSEVVNKISYFVKDSKLGKASQNVWKMLLEKIKADYYYLIAKIYEDDEVIYKKYEDLCVQFYQETNKYIDISKCTRSAEIISHLDLIYYLNEIEKKDMSKELAYKAIEQLKGKELFKPFESDLQKLVDKFKEDEEDE